MVVEWAGAVTVVGGGPVCLRARAEEGLAAEGMAGVDSEEQPVEEEQEEAMSACHREPWEAEGSAPVAKVEG